MKNKKIIRGMLFFAGILLTIIPGALSADGGLLFGQKHYYSLVFRGNGEAIVYAKIVVTNSDSSPLNKLSFEIPDAKVNELTVFEQTLPPKCKQHDRYNECIEYDDPDYDSYYYSSYSKDNNGTYHKVAVENSGATYNLTLPVPIDPQKSGAVIVSYASRGYVKNRLGLSHFNFSTLKVPARINAVKVAVSVDSDLVIKGKKSTVNYNMLDAQEFSSPLSSSSFGSASMDKLAGSIGSDGAIIKDAKNLSPNETFSVSGVYASSWIRLYLSSVLIVVIFIILVLTSTILLMKRQKKTNSSGADHMSGQVSPSETSTTASLINWPRSALVTFISALITTTLTFLLQALFDSELMNSLDIGPMIGIIGIIAIVILYLMVVFGPVVMLSSGKGWKAFMSSLGLEFLWLVITIIIFIILFPSA